jgi:hypothetical protein
MTSHQEQLIAKLAGEKIEASFNGRFLNCRVAVHAGPKTKWQKFSFVFDSETDCQGSRLVPASCRGAYSESFARDAAKIIFAHSAEIGALPIE